MATVRAYSVCQSDGTNNAPTVYSYSVAPDLQDGSPLAFDAATPEDASVRVSNLPTVQVVQLLLMPMQSAMLTPVV